MLKINNFFLSQSSETTSIKASSIDFNSIAINAFPMVLIFVVFYFFIIRPQKKKQDEQQQMINSLNSGSEVLLTSGVYGKISSVPLDKDFCFVNISENSELLIKIDKKEIAKILK
jgi:preprotein translocase subunit YajC